MIATILAGGFSASRVDLRRLPGTVIAVNDSMLYAPKWDIGVSMDRLWSENRWGIVIEKTTKPIWLRTGTLKNVRATDCDHVMQYENDHTSTTLSEDPRVLNGTHSGFCALNLAYHLRPSELYLVGFDMQLGPRGERHWHPDYPWKSGGGSGPAKLFEWSTQIKTAIEQLSKAQIATFVVSRDSTIRGFKRVEPSSLGAVCA